jgi:hypothetical protein
MFEFKKNLFQKNQIYKFVYLIQKKNLKSGKKENPIRTFPISNQRDFLGRNRVEAVEQFGSRLYFARASALSV